MEDIIDMNIIYGAGDFGQRLLSYFNKIGLTIDCFCQTTTSQIKEIQGVPVCILADVMKDDSGQKNFFIAIANKAVSHQIKLNIMAKSLLGGEVCNVVEYGDFIATNLLLDKDKRYCILCGNFSESFYDFGIDSGIFQEYHIIGGGKRSNCICPKCGSNDRNRWIYYVLLTKTNICTHHSKVLHFAPETKISELLRANKQCDYYSGDYVAGRAMHQVDATDIQFKDNTFDYIIMNHVLEHILNEAKAMNELKRVLKHDGKLIISFPICTDFNTIEENEPLSAAERLNRFGQEDHVRLYGIDYRERMEKYGFSVNVFTPNEQLSNDIIEKYGFIYDDIVMILHKK